VDLPIGRQLALTSKALQHWIDERLAPHGSSLTTWIVLWNTAAAEAPGLSQRELAGRMSIGGPALVRHIDRLEAEGHIRRTRDRQDRRITRVTLTTKGHAHLTRLKIVMDESDALIREQLSEPELRSVQRALARLDQYVTANPYAAPTTTPARSSSSTRPFTETDVA